jgi:hypothetical protein
VTAMEYRPLRSTADAVTLAGGLQKVPPAIVVVRSRVGEHEVLRVCPTCGEFIPEEHSFGNPHRPSTNHYAQHYVARHRTIKGERRMATKTDEQSVISDEQREAALAAAGGQDEPSLSERHLIAAENDREAARAREIAAQNGDGQPQQKVRATTKMTEKYGAAIMERSRLAAEDTPLTHPTGPKDHQRIEKAVLKVLKSRDQKPSSETLAPLVDREGNVDEAVMAIMKPYSKTRVRESIRAWVTQVRKAEKAEKAKARRAEKAAEAAASAEQG